MRTKHYVKFIDLYEWAWNHDYQSTAETFASGLSSLFDGTLDNPYKSGEKLPFIMNDEQLNEIWLDYFEEKEVMWELRYGRYDVSTHKRIETYDEAMFDIMARFGQRINEIVRLNKPRWVKLIGSTDFTYNPIENYRMVETEEINDEGTGSRTLEKDGTVDLTQSGKETYDRSIKTSEISSIEITAPLSSLSGTMVDGVYSISDVGFSLNTEKTTTTALGESSGVEQGKTKGSTDATYNSQTKKAESSATTAAGTTPTSTSYSTTYDDTETDRKTGKAETTGSVGTARTLSEVSAESINAIGSITTGNPNAYGYTDTIDFDNRSSLTTYDTLDTERTSKENARERELTRSGNIGVTTSQQMIQSERDLLLSVAKVIMFEVADEIFLRTWG